jgi:hypothetical protein
MSYLCCCIVVARESLDALSTYSPKCLEGIFSELRQYGILGSSHPALCIAPVLCVEDPAQPKTLRTAT